MCRFAGIPILTIVGIVALGSVKKYQQISQDVYAHAGSIAEQAFSGIRTVYVPPPPPPPLPVFYFCFPPPSPTLNHVIHFGFF